MTSNRPRWKADVGKVRSSNVQQIIPFNFFKLRTAYACSLFLIYENTFVYKHFSDNYTRMIEDDLFQQVATDNVGFPSFVSREYENYFEDNLHLTSIKSA